MTQTSQTLTASPIYAKGGGQLVLGKCFPQAELATDNGLPELFRYNESQVRSYELKSRMSDWDVGAW
jgi:hypothetical protein